MERGKDGAIVEIGFLGCEYHIILIKKLNKLYKQMKIKEKLSFNLSWG